MQKLRIAFKRTDSPVVYCALTVGTGTRNEDSKYNGLAHFTEHMLFKGTSKRSSLSINNYLEREGGELNAYTTKEETVLQATVLKEDLQKAVSLILELCFDSVFPQDQVTKEREVIYDEIISYKDSPEESICDDFESIFFEGHDLAMPILGKRESLKRINTQILKDYLTCNFTPDNICLSVVGDSSFKDIFKIVSRSLAKFNLGDIELVPIEESTCRQDSVGQQNIIGSQGGLKLGSVYDDLKIGNSFDKIVNKRNHQVHCILGCSAYSWSRRERLHLALLANMLGGPSSNSRLNMSLRERNGFVYNIEAIYTPYSDTGLFTILFGCDKQYVDRCFKLIYNELDALVESPIKESDLKRIKKQFIGQLSISLDNAESQVLSMGKSVLVYNRISSFDEIKESVERITAEDLFKVAKAIFPKERFSKLIYQ